MASIEQLMQSLERLQRLSGASILGRKKRKSSSLIKKNSTKPAKSLKNKIIK